MFEGPMDLLMHLIEKNEIDIYDIPISVITEQYIEYIKSLQELDLEVTSEFIVMAATLIEIKSKMLLPKTENEKDDDDELDPRDELVQKLIEYKKYKQVADQLKEREDIQQKVYYKPKEEIEYYGDERQLLLDNVKLYDIFCAFERVIKKFETKDPEISEKRIRTIKRDEMTIEEAMHKIRNLVSTGEKISFFSLFDGYYSKTAIVVTFLAVLELVKMSDITVEQDDNFGELYLKFV